MRNEEMLNSLPHMNISHTVSNNKHMIYMEPEIIVKQILKEIKYISEFFYYNLTI